jgi:cold shock CspA family protein
MPVGQINRINHPRGFGFIRPFERAEPDLFFHLRALIDLPWSEALVGVTVRYDVKSGLRGLTAENVRPE